MLIIGILCVVVIASYIFDTIAKKTRFPSVIMLITLGAISRIALDYIDITVPFLDEILPTLGNVGLILIVLEGALDLELSKDKTFLIFSSFASSLVIMLLCVFGLTVFFQYSFNMGWEKSLINAIPLSIISSAIAIPSTKSLINKSKEFIVYESTFSDILGIILFNFVIRHYTQQKTINFQSFIDLGQETFMVIVVAIIVTFLLFELIEKITSHVKFFLILAILILAFVVGKKLHLSSLIVVFVFGLFMSNPDVLLPDFLKKWVSTTRAKEDFHLFQVLTEESTFLIKTFFFLIFGYSITIEMFSDPYVFFYAAIILGIIISSRFLYLSIFSPKNVQTIGFIAPRGLISILLFLQIPTALESEFIDKRVLLIVIISTLLWMLFGTMSKREKENLVKTLTQPKWTRIN